MEIVIIDTGFAGVGAKDILVYIFVVPATALLIKQRVMPIRAIPNEIFIPPLRPSSSWPSSIRYDCLAGSCNMQFAK
ncbi:hypothetical protein MLD38_007611 [Melastoma candidum]|uniref:Uncharacterized protein n=1 Tax=Melastoma candidum TaxID=119954 RepID=A0ACB9RUP4_9MYRT|nr:hypothetical protein MLD38_007611 [Melastoma candidum]